MHLAVSHEPGVLGMVRRCAEKWIAGAAIQQLQTNFVLWQVVGVYAVLGACMWL